MVKIEKTSKKSNYNFSERLRICRESKKYTQEQLSEKIGKSPNYISMLENGKRTNPSVKVINDIAKALDVSVEYLTCQTNQIKPLALHYAADDYIKRDTYLLKSIESAGHKLRFGVVPLYDGRKPVEVELNYKGEKIPVRSYEHLERIVLIDDIENISFLDGKCVLKDGKSKCEAVIKKVYLNDNELSTANFVNWLNNLNLLINCNVKSLQEYIMNGISTSTLDENIDDLIKNSRDRCID